MKILLNYLIFCSISGCHTWKMLIAREKLQQKKTLNNQFREDSFNVLDLANGEIDEEEWFFDSSFKMFYRVNKIIVMENQ